ncbi:MAG: S41 family peptidase [Pyrinomonadaceae bacterium]
MKAFKLTIVLILFVLAVNAQDKLPTIKSNANVISIQDGDEFRKNVWTLAPDAKPDIYQTSVKKGAKKKVTFITDLDNISFEVEAGKTYDFIIQKGDAICYTQIKADELKFWNDPDFWESPALKTLYKPNISDAEKIAGLSKFWSEVKYNFVNFHLVQDLDWDKTYLEFIPKVLATNSTLEYYKVLMELCAKLGDAHTNIYLPNELSNEFYARPLVRSRLIEGKVLIIGVYDESIKQNGIAEGQEILEIDGMPVKRYAEKYVKPYQSASTPQDLQTRMFEYALFSGSIKSPINLTLRTSKGTLLKRTISRVTSEERSKKLPAPPPMEFRMLPQNIAYITINTFNNSVPADLFAEKFAEISKADAIIFDVRNNGGGNSGVGDRIFSFLTDKPFSGSNWFTREYHPAFRAWGRTDKAFGSAPDDASISLDEVKAKRGLDVQPFLKPVVVLSSSRTFSAAEDFLANFKSTKRGLVIGEASGGSTGQPLFFTLPGGGSARVCAKHDTLSDGTEFVGVGIIPDVLAKPKVSDFTEGTDAVLEIALQELAKSFEN